MTIIGIQAKRRSYFIHIGKKLTHTKEDNEMNTDRIREIQKATAYPESLSVYQALLQVWNECEQENNRIKVCIWEQACNKVREQLSLENPLIDNDFFVTHINPENPYL